MTMRRSTRDTVRSSRSPICFNCRMYSSSRRHDTVVVLWRFGCFNMIQGKGPPCRRMDGMAGVGVN